MKSLSIHANPMALGGLVVAGIFFIAAGWQSVSSRTSVQIPAPAVAGTGLATLKILGQPAASEWIDIESNQLGQAETVYVVPTGKVLTLHSGFRLGNMGLQNESTTGHVLIGAIEVTGLGLFPGESTAIREGWVAKEGQTVTIGRTGGSAPSQFTFLLRGWMEDMQ